ncbi:MAG: hypothetical protein OFPII_39480 [Osedax symbiont Rs1]|nr:MAG: hypothetical protein OFPII_39480 [Osedax symbiont Rs1]
MKCIDIKLILSGNAVDINSYLATNKGVKNGAYSEDPSKRNIRL